MNTIKSIPAGSWLALLCLFAPPAAHAATYYVAATGSDANPGTQLQPFGTIQRGIDAAQHGDLVFVANGNYSGVNFGGKNITLRSLEGAAACVIRGSCVFRSGETRAAILDGFTIRDNLAASGVSIWNNSNPTIIRCRIVNNRLGVVSTGGGVFIDSSPLIDSCLITQNSAERGGGMRIQGGSPVITNCTFSSNSVSPNTVTLDACSGGAIDIVSGANPTIANCSFNGNGAARIGTAGGLGGALALSGSSATITDCLFNANSSASAGGGVYVAGGSVTLNRCRFSGNRAYDSSRGDGGGLLLESGAHGTLVSCLFAGNQAVRDGGGIYVGYRGSTLTVLHSTFTGNTKGIRSAVLQQNTLVMTNSIVFNNPGGEIFGFTSYAVGFSDVGGGFSGTGNINADPLFQDPVNVDFRLQPASPCINAGSAAASGLTTLDLDGAPRNVGGAPDMGAYESTPGFWFVDAARGNDANAGTAAGPFQTLSQALSAATAGNTIYIKGGNYGSDRPRITQSLRLLNWGEAGPARLGQQ